jgi:ATP-dependent DNA ligase
LQNPDTWINLALSVRLAERCPASGNTMKDQTVRKRLEAAFIEPMRCKPVTALPAGENWTFEIKFDGYRCIAVKRGRELTVFPRQEGAEQAISQRRPSARLARE